MQKIIQLSKQEYMRYERKDRMQTKHKHYNFYSGSVPLAPTSTPQYPLRNFTIICPKLQSDSFSRLTIQNSVGFAWDHQPKPNPNQPLAYLGLDEPIS